VGPTRAADDAATVQLVDYFLKTPTAEVNPKLVDPFLAVDPDALPRRRRDKARAKQLEIRTLLKLHDTKKKGSWLGPVEGCTLSSIVHPLMEMGAYRIAGFSEITEDELDYVMEKTKCKEIDLGCQFSLIIFFDKGKPRHLMLSANDPLNATIAEFHAGHVGGQTNFFGKGTFTCHH